MFKNKKTPMYVSTTNPNGNTYDFVDFTTPTNPLVPSVSEQAAPTTQIDSQIIRKIQTLYKSQLLDIQESKEEDNHHQDIMKDSPTQADSENGHVLQESTNLYKPFSHLKRLETHKTFGGYDEEDCQSLSSYPNSDSNKIIHHPIRRANTSIRQYSQFYSPPKYNFSGSQYTSDQIISMLPNPFRDSLELLKIRIKSRQKML